GADRHRAGRRQPRAGGAVPRRRDRQAGEGRLMARKPIRSDLAWSSTERIVVRGKDLPREILGELNLGDMAFLELTGRRSQAQIGIEPVGGSPEQAAQFLDAEIAKRAKVD